MELIVHKTSSFCFDSLPMLASTLYKLSKYQPEAIRNMLDALVETLRSGIEENFVCISKHQNLLSQAMFIGWLFRSSLISAETFALLLTTNSNSHGFLQRITCALLKSCIDPGSSKLLPPYKFEKDSSLMLAVERSILAMLSVVFIYSFLHVGLFCF